MNTERRKEQQRRASKKQLEMPVLGRRFLVKNFIIEEIGHRNCKCKGCEQAKVKYLTKYGVKNV